MCTCYDSVRNLCGSSSALFLFLLFLVSDHTVELENYTYNSPDKCSAVEDVCSRRRDEERLSARKAVG